MYTFFCFSFFFLKKICFQHSVCAVWNSQYNLGGRRTYYWDETAIKWVIFLCSHCVLGLQTSVIMQKSRSVVSHRTLQQVLSEHYLKSRSFSKPLLLICSVLGFLSITDKLLRPLRGIILYGK